MSGQLPDLSQLAQQLTTILAPALPYLIAGGIEAAKGAAGKVGEKSLEASITQAKKLWDKLQPKMAAKEAGREAVADIVKTPTDPEAQILCVSARHV